MALNLKTVAKQNKLRQSMEYQDIVAYVSEKHGISQLKLNTRTRMGPETKARQEIMYMAFVNEMTISEIAERIDRNYATVKHGIKAHGKLVREAKRSPQPMHRSGSDSKRRLRERLFRINIKMGSISGLIEDLVSEEVSEFILNETIRGDYESVAELIADYVTEIYFQQKDKR